MPARLLPLAALGAAAVTALTIVPAQAATNHLVCSDQPTSARICVGVQTEGSDVRGYAAAVPRSGGVTVDVRSIVLQRRTCGGAWHDWTTVQDPDSSRTKDVAATQYVAFPGGVQFRTLTAYRAESSSTGAGRTLTSRVHGTC